MCFIATLVNLQSPLEQFEVSSYGTSLTMSVTNSVNLINEAFVPTYIKYSFINLFFVFMLYSIIKYIEFSFKQEGFLLLFFFITVLYTCFNLYSFTDFTVSEKSFQYFIKDNLVDSSMNLIFIDDFEIGSYFTFMDWINALPNFLFEYYTMNICFISSPLMDRHFIIESYLPNLIVHSKLLVGYAWFFGYLFNLDFLNRLDETSSDFCLTLLNKFQNWSMNDKMNWSLLLEDVNFIYFKDIFLPKYQYIIDSIQYSLSNNNLLTNENHFYNYIPFEMPNWIVFILIFVGIFLAGPESTVNLNMEAPISLDILIQEPYALLNYIENNISNNIFIDIYSQIIYLSNTISYQMIKSMEYMIMLKQSALNLSNNGLININNIFNLKNIEELFIKNFFDNNIFITINTSFINMYSILFCFIFIFFIIYLLFNKSFTYNINTIIPNLYQMLGENLYKVSLNLFYSILGKHITHPEFYIKINTIFLFLVISNVQGWFLIWVL